MVSVRNEKGTGGTSPGSVANIEKSMPPEIGTTVPWTEVAR